MPSAACCRVTDNQYTTRTAPIAWRACETFASHRSAGTIVLEASDVFMLGCTFIEVLTGCSREPYDWLTGEQLITFRAHDTTRDLSPLLVRDSALRCLPAFRTLTQTPRFCAMCSQSTRCRLWRAGGVGASTARRFVLV